jgi:hypothetical protein
MLERWVAWYDRTGSDAARAHRVACSAGGTTVRSRCGWESVVKRSAVGETVSFGSAWADFSTSHVQMRQKHQSQYFFVLSGV